MIYYITEYHTYAITHPVDNRYAHLMPVIPLMPIKVLEVIGGKPEDQWREVAEFDPREMDRAVSYADAQERFWMDKQKFK